MKTFPLTQTLRRSLGACSIALGLMAALPAAAATVTFTAPGQQLGFDVTLDLSSLAKPSIIRWSTPQFGIATLGPYASSISYEIFDGLGGTGSRLYSGSTILGVTGQSLIASGILDGSYSVLLTMTSDPASLAVGNLGGQLANGGVGVDLTATARVRPIDLSTADSVMSMNLTAIPQATVPEPGSLALVALAGLLAGGLKRRAARG